MINLYNKLTFTYAKLVQQFFGKLLDFFSLLLARGVNFSVCLFSVEADQPVGMKVLDGSVVAVS